MSGPVSAIGAALEEMGPGLVPDFDGRMRSAVLFEDIRDLGGAFQSRSVDIFDDEAAALGALYVLEGSRLGGRVLARRVSFVSPRKRGIGTRF